jgi:integrase
MTVYQEKRGGKPTGIFIAEKVLAGERRRARFETQKAAQKWYDVATATGAFPVLEGQSDPRSFAEVAKEARANREGWKASRDPSLDQRLEDVVSLIGPSTKIGDVRLSKINTMVKTLESRKGREGTLSHKTINRYLAVLSGVLSYAHASEYIPGVPALPWREESRGRMFIFSQHQEDVVCSLLGDEAMVLTTRVLAATALRPGEFWSLEAEQVEDDWVRLWETKTDKPRSVPIDAALARPLRRLVIEGRLPDPDVYYRALKAACASAGLPDELTTYSLRHTGLTRLAQRGENGATIQKWAGHGDYRTTQNYVHLFDEDLKRAHERALASAPSVRSA